MGGEYITDSQTSVCRGEVTAEKRIERLEKGRFLVAIQLDASTAKGRRVVLEENIPNTDDLIDLRFHEDGDQWSLEQDVARFETFLESDSVVETHYEVAYVDPDRSVPAAEPPQITRIDGEAVSDNGYTNPDAKPGAWLEEARERYDDTHTVAKLRIHFAGEAATTNEIAVLDGLASTCTVVAKDHRELGPEVTTTVIDVVIATVDPIPTVVESLEKLSYVEAVSATVRESEERDADSIEHAYEGDLSSPEDELSLEETIAYGEREMEHDSQTSTEELDETNDQEQADNGPEAEVNSELSDRIDASADGDEGAVPSEGPEEDEPDSRDTLGAESGVEPADSTPGQPKVVTTGTTLETLIEDLEANALDEEQVTRLFETLEEAKPRSQTVRLRSLESRVQELSAYADAMEAFIDESGTANELIDEVGATQGGLASLEDRSDAIEERADDVESRTKAIEATVESLDERLVSIEEAVTAIEGNQMSIQEQVEDHDEILEKLTSVFQSV